MNLTWVDWAIVGGFLVALIGIAAWTKRYTRSVGDFLAANRCAGRYLLTMSEGMAALGTAAVVANFEKFYQAGFAASWWGLMLGPIGLIVALSGWVLYRYRETRALTMAQFFEMRYSRRFRIFAGVLAWVSGILNYGIFPAVTGRFMMYFCGLPEHIDALGMSVPTYPLVLAGLLSIAVWLTLAGGMITVMITDFLQAQFVNIVFLIMMAVLVMHFSWSDVAATLKAAPEGKSLVDPFDQSGISDFNFWFFAIFAFKAFYNCLGWQGSQGYNAAAKSPHEAKMSRVLGEWRSGVTYLIIMLMPICAYVLLHDAQFSAAAADVNGALGQIGDEQVRKQMTVPVALAEVLPVGVIGLFVAAMLAAAVSTDDTYLHSWGSIFIQDVVLPFRGKPLTPAQHIRILRISIVGVAVFAFFFSWLFPVTDYLFMWFLITGTIYLGGSGAVIIGGLYWKRGTTQGAWAAMLVGCGVALVGISLQVLWPRVEALATITPKFPINGAWLAMIAYLCSIAAYVGVSLLTCREAFNLEKLLHRGAYADADSAKPATGWKALGITPEFTRGDKAIYYFKLGWTTFWFLAFAIGCVLGLTVGISEDAWVNWWLFTIVLGAVVGVVTVVWFLWGGVRDLAELMRVLGRAERNTADDGLMLDEAERAAALAEAEKPKDPSLVGNRGETIAVGTAAPASPSA